MITTITITQIPGGWTVIRTQKSERKTEEVMLATTCGGNLGGILAVEVAKTAAVISMADHVEFDAPHASRLVCDAFDSYFSALKGV